MMHRLASSSARRGTNFSSCQWRRLASSSSSSSSYTARSPAAETKTWERSASKVKDTDLSDNNPYLDAIRETHDPSQHLKTVEDELKGSIGSALGKQSGKIMNFTALMEKELEKYNDVLQQQQQQTANGTDGTIGADTAVLLEEIAAKYNELREHALKSRWELTVHRQAAGFIVNNYQDVDKYHPIGAKLTVDKPVRVDDGVDGSTAEADEKPAEKKFGDQLDWWQEIGRWRGG